VQRQQGAPARSIGDRRGTGRTIGARFAKDTGLSIYEADAKTIEAFTETITNQKLRVVKPDA